MVCELDENRLLAETILTIITRLIKEHVTSLEQKKAEVSQAILFTTVSSKAPILSL